MATAVAYCNSHRQFSFGTQSVCNLAYNGGLLDHNCIEIYHAIEHSNPLFLVF